MDKQRVEIGTPKLLRYGFIVAGVVTFCFGIFLVIGKHEAPRLAGLVPIFLSVVFFVVGSLLIFVFNKPIIAFDKDGLEFQPCKGIIPWSDVELVEEAVVGLGRKGKTPCVCIRLKETSKFKPGPKAGLDNILSSVAGDVFDYHVFSELIDMHPEKIVAKMSGFIGQPHEEN